MFIVAVDDLLRQKAAFNVEFDRRMTNFEGGSEKKPRRTKFPQKKYACCCPTMRTYRGDVTSSTCKACIKNGAAIPHCWYCKCQCQTGIFLEKDIQAMANKKLRLDEMKARERVPNTDQRSLKNLGSLIVSSVSDGLKLLSSSNSRLDKNNVLSAASGHLSRMQLPSKEELHSLQQHVPLTMKLQGTQVDVWDFANANPRKKGKRHYQNGLR